MDKIHYSLSGLSRKKTVCWEAVDKVPPGTYFQYFRSVSSVSDLMDNDNSILGVVLMWEKPMNFSQRVIFSQKIQMDKSDVLLSNNDMPNWKYYNGTTSTQL